MSSKRKLEEAAELEVELLFCTHFGNLQRIRELVELQRVSLESRCPTSGKTPLMIAVGRGHAPITRFLLNNKAQVEATDADGDTALGHALDRHNLQQARLLLEHGANVEALIRKNAPIVLAIYRRDVAMVALLLRFGAKTDRTIDCGKPTSALVLASRLQRLEIVELLLRHGVDVNAITPRKESALCEVCVHNRLDMARLLIGKGARVLCDDPYGPSPLECAVECAVPRGSLELIKLLLVNAFPTGTSDEDKDFHPLTEPLKVALWQGRFDVAQLLVDHGALKSGYPYLYYCANRGSIEGGRWLLRAGANVNEPWFHNSGETPLWAAANGGHANMVQALLQAGANVNIRHDGETPLGAAYRQGHKDCVYLLLRTSPHVWPRLKKFM